MTHRARITQYSQRSASQPRDKNPRRPRYSCPSAILPVYTGTLPCLINIYKVHAILFFQQFKILTPAYGLRSPTLCHVFNLAIYSHCCGLAIRYSMDRTESALAVTIEAMHLKPVQRLSHICPSIQRL